MLSKRKLKKTHRNSATENELMLAITHFFEQIAMFCSFMFRLFSAMISPPFEMKELLKQAYYIGYKSFPLVMITGFIMGLVLTIQSRPTLAQFGATSWLPAMVAVSIVREIGPVITALIFAGKVGSGIGAELGSMKVTEQIDAMEVSGINPFKYLVFTRVMAATWTLPILVVLADAIGLLGAFIGVNLKGEVNFQLFVIQVFDKLSFSDLLPSVFKTFFFGFFIGLIGCYKGYHATNGTVGVGQSANEAVVMASFSVFIIDLIAVQLTSLLS